MNEKSILDHTHSQTQNQKQDPGEKPETEKNVAGPFCLLMTANY